MACEVSHVPNLNVVIVQVNLLSARGCPAHDALCKVESERDGVQRHHLQNGFGPKGEHVRAYTPKVYPRLKAAGKVSGEKGLGWL